MPGLMGDFSLHQSLFVFAEFSDDRDDQSAETDQQIDDLIICYSATTSV